MHQKKEKDVNETRTLLEQAQTLYKEVSWLRVRPLLGG